jgi:hypothetical protein
VIVAADWVTISALATAGGTLVLAFATFASVRSANRAARVAERSLLVGLRPVLMPSRLDDPPQKVGFADGKWLHLQPGAGAAEATEQNVYLAIAVRNAGSGIAVLHGWRFFAEQMVGVDEHAPLDEFTRLTRDIYVPAGDVGFWQGTFRDPSTAQFVAARRAVEDRRPIAVEILYGDHEGGQRTISRFALIPHENDDGWIAAVARHWSVDRPGPR